ncbi:MAG: FAD-dependent oxidoreductase [Reyranella sp.]|uniref:FAD-dependent oxidoreductase n=1 Tax=Reyranella sp. TaxID=1929291 RepID=UPI001AD0B93D|nr:FAD-dependent oxidoreductase [Reyranella sp.]MBN9091345.1 FAD-dependent oxidoreductase [Reyranella sp.]
METDVLICGAGAAGLTLAVELARRGVAFRLIDAAAQPFHGSRGKGIQPRTLEVFEDLGIVDRMVAAGGPYPPQRVHRDGGFDDSPFMEISDPTPREPYRIPLMLPQHKTEAILRERLAELSHRPRYGEALESFTQDADGVAAIVNGAPMRVRYLIGCDGGRSTVRQTLSIGFPGETLGVRALVADLDLEGLSRDAWHRWNDGKPESMSLCPLMGTDQFQLQARIPGDGEVDLSAVGLEAMIASRTRRDDLKVHSVSWASAYSMNARLADRYQVGRVFLAGDAAHTHPPTGGQGLNTSVQDSYNLGWKLAAALDGASSLLATYEEERRPIAAGMLGLATRLLQATRTGGGNRRGRAEQQLDLGYPESSLARGPNAGNRAPDAPVRGAAGQPTRLFTLFQGTHWTLLVYDAPSPIAARAGLRIYRVGGDIVDDQGLVREHYGLAPGDCVLVRPDGYIGAMTRDAAVLDRYLDAVI